MAYACALITGATSGIGAAFAAALPETTDLLLTGRNETALAQARQRLSRGARRVHTLAADLGTPAGRQVVMATAEEIGIDLLINNAGVGPFGPVLDTSLADQVQCISVNVEATVSLTGALLPGMLARARHARRRCGVILLSSQMAFQPFPFLAVYGGTKAFILAYGEALAEEVRRDPADVLVLCPGITRTAFGQRAGFGRDIPIAASPDKVAREGLDALGKRSVHICGFAPRLALNPMVLARRCATSGLGHAMEWFTRRRPTAPKPSTNGGAPSPAADMPPEDTPPGSADVTAPLSGYTGT